MSRLVDVTGANMIKCIVVDRADEAARRTGDAVRRLRQEGAERVQGRARKRRVALTGILLVGFLSSSTVAGIRQYHEWLHQQAVAEACAEIHRLAVICGAHARKQREIHERVEHALLIADLRQDGEAKARIWDIAATFEEAEKRAALADNCWELYPKKVHPDPEPDFFEAFPARR